MRKSVTLQRLKSVDNTGIIIHFFIQGFCFSHQNIRFDDITQILSGEQDAMSDSQERRYF